MGEDEPGICFKWHLSPSDSYMTFINIGVDMPNIICMKYLYLWLYSPRRCSFTIHQLVEKSQAGAKCDCPFFLRPLQTTRYLGVFLPLTKTVQGTGNGMDQARLGDAHCSSGVERLWDHGQRSTGGLTLLWAVSCEWRESLSLRVSCSHGTDSTQTLQGQFEHLLERPADWSNSIAQV